MSRPHVFVVLGMHKSGTTLVAEMLQASGIEMVEDYDQATGYDAGNDCERLETTRINKDLLDWHGSGSLSHKAPGRLQPTPELRDGMKAVARCAERAESGWGFKDPRTCLTYPLWKSILPEHCLIGVYRNYGDVSARYAYGFTGKRHQRKPWKRLRTSRTALDRWFEYNVRIADILERSPMPSILISYDRLMSEPAEFQRLKRFIPAPLHDARKAGRHRNRRGRGLWCRLAERMPSKDAGSCRELLQRLEGIRSEQIRAQPSRPPGVEPKSPVRGRGP